MISLYNNIYWSSSSSLFSFLTTYFLLLILTSLFVFAADQDFCFLLQDICAAKDDLFLDYVVSRSFHSFVCCVFSHMCWWTCVSWCDCWSMICRWRLSIVTIGWRACAHQQWDRKRHQHLSLVSVQLVQVILVVIFCCRVSYPPRDSQTIRYYPIANLT